MGEDEAALELGHRLGGDAGLGQAAEAGVDAIGGAAFLDDAPHDGRRSLDRAPGGGIDLDPAPVGHQPLEIAEGELARPEPEDLVAPLVVAHRRASPTCLYNFGLIARAAHSGKAAEDGSPGTPDAVPRGTRAKTHVGFDVAGQANDVAAARGAAGGLD